MIDLISRRAAIDALAEAMPNTKENRDESDN